MQTTDRRGKLPEAAEDDAALEPSASIANAGTPPVTGDNALGVHSGRGVEQSHHDGAGSRRWDSEGSIVVDGTRAVTRLPSDPPSGPRVAADTAAPTHEAIDLHNIETLVHDSEDARKAAADQDVTEGGDSLGVPESTQTPQTVWASHADGDARSGAEEPSGVTPFVSKLLAFSPWLSLFGLAPPPSFDGTWYHRDHPLLTEVIRGETVRGPDGTVKKITVTAKDKFSIVRRGRAYEAQLAGDHLFWDDGDVWIRRPEVVDAFDGCWTHRDRPGFVETISGDQLRGPDGTRKTMAILGNDRFSIVRKGRTYQARLVGRQLVWDDGDVWIRAEPLPKAPEAYAAAFQGRWMHKGKPGVFEVIRGDTVEGPSGEVTRMAAFSRDGFALVLKGEMYRAQLIGDTLQWNDGDVWVRAPQADAMASPPPSAARPPASTTAPNGAAPPWPAAGAGLNGLAPPPRPTGPGGPAEASFNGRWRHRSNPDLLEVIRGGTVQRRDGTVTKITVLAHDRFSVHLKGAEYRARLVGDQLVWNDGDVWVRS